MNRKALSLAVLVAGAYPATSYALSLGDIESNSNLNQPLRAKIELLSASTQEARQLEVRLAPNSVFNRVGVDRPAFLDSLRFTSTVQNGKPIILITSDQPVSEPFVNFLVEVSWPQGQLLKEYTVMLNPPVLMQPGTALAGNEATVRAEPRAATGAVNRVAQQQPQQQQRARQQQTQQQAQARQQQVQQQQAQQQRARQQQAQQQQAQQQRARQQQAQAQQQRARQQQAQQQARAAQQRQASQNAARASTRTYRVRSGDTLFKVASRLRQPGVNVDQMMMALYRANPRAFIKGNINGLKAGAVLQAPSGRAAKSTSRAQARRQVRKQYADWKKFRSTLAQRTVPQQRANTGSNRTQTARTNASSNNDKARLEVLGRDDKSSGGKSGTAAGSDRLNELEKQLALARESMVARQRENKELKSRVNDLESMLRKKNRLISLRDDQLAQLQKQLASNGIESSVTAQATTGGNGNQQANNGSTNGSANNNVVPRTQGVTRPLEKDIQNQVANATQAEQNKIVRAGQPDNNNLAQNAIDNQKPAPAFVDQQDDGNDLMAMLTSPMAWKIGAGALFSLLLLWLLSRLLGRRKSAPKKAPLVADEPVIFDADNDSLGAMQEDQSFRELEVELDKAEKGVDTDDDPFGMGMGSADNSDGDNNYTTVSPDIIEAGADQDEDEVLMEANVYIAYGLHQQAESELQKALEKHPDRLDYRHKLLENYFASNDREEFDRNAEAFLAAKGADRNNKMWQEIAEWGKKISPGNRLYTEQSNGGLGMGTAVAAAGAAVAGVAGAAASAITLGSDNEADATPAADNNNAAAAAIAEADNLDDMLNGLQEDDDLGLDDFDFDLDDLESELAGEPEAPEVPVAQPERVEVAGEEVAHTVDNNDLDFNLDDLVNELEQDDDSADDELSALQSELAAEVDDLPDVPEDNLADGLDFDDLLNGDKADVSLEAAGGTVDGDEGIGLMGGLAAGAVAAAGATAAAVMSGKEKVVEKLSDAGDEVGNALDIGAEPEIAETAGSLDFDLQDALPDLNELPGVEDDFTLARGDDAGDVGSPVLSAGLDAEAEVADELEMFDFDLGNADPTAEEPLSTAADIAAESTGEAADNVTNLNLHLDKESGLKKILPEDTFYTSDGAQAADSAGDEESWMGDIDDALSFLDMPDEEIDLHEAHISTKLDLARAYLDMGDVEGARSTLEEVMVEGNDTQRQEAETLLHQTG